MGQNFASPTSNGRFFHGEVEEKLKNTRLNPHIFQFRYGMLTMEKKVNTKQLLKILVGAAWIDGIIQPEERNYLHRMAKNNNLADDPEIKSLLSEIKPVHSTECCQWLEEYLGQNPSSEDYQSLLEAISALIYSDGDVQMQEANLLTKLQNLDPSSESSKSTLDKLLKIIQKLYKKAVSQQA